MSVRIRLRRMGKKKSPHYRLAVVDSRVKRDGRFVEFVGYYNPMTEPPSIKLEEEKIVGWIKNGASCSDTVSSILRDAGVLAKMHEMKTGQKVVKGVAQPEVKPAKAEKPTAAKKKEKSVAAAPAVEAETSIAADAPAVETETPVAADAPAVEAETPVAVDAPAVEAETPLADEAAQAPAEEKNEEK